MSAVMNKQKTREQLEQQVRQANQALNRLRDEDRRAKNAPLIGKTFRYRNSYSCPEKASDYWWLYAKVTKLDGDGSLKLFTFETDKYGHIKITPDGHAYNMDSGYQPISAAEYRKALKALKSRVAKF
jgi:type II secretory pathway pseudopilin PulG